MIQSSPSGGLFHFRYLLTAGTQCTPLPLKGVCKFNDLPDREAANRLGLCQVLSEKRSRPSSPIHTRLKAKSPKEACFKHFRAKQKPSTDKISFINRWLLIWKMLILLIHAGVGAL